MKNKTKLKKQLARQRSRMAPPAPIPPFENPKGLPLLHDVYIEYKRNHEYSVLDIWNYTYWSGYDYEKVYDDIDTVINGLDDKTGFRHIIYLNENDNTEQRLWIMDSHGLQILSAEIEYCKDFLDETQPHPY